MHVMYRTHFIVTVGKSDSNFSICCDLPICIDFVAALYGVLFPQDKEAAFANNRMWDSLAFVIAFAYSTFICLEIKLYVILGILLLAMVTYPVVEFYEHRHPTLPSIEGESMSQKGEDDARMDGKGIICQAQM